MDAVQYRADGAGGRPNKALCFPTAERLLKVQLVGQRGAAAVGESVRRKGSLFEQFDKRPADNEVVLDLALCSWPTVRIATRQ